MSRFWEIDRTWNVSAEDFLERPFSGEASTGMCQGAVSTLGSHAVNGTIILSGSLASASLLTITQGRIFLISAPLVGSRLTSQTSPRFTRNHLRPARGRR